MSCWELLFGNAAMSTTLETAVGNMARRSALQVRRADRRVRRRRRGARQCSAADWRRQRPASGRLWSRKDIRQRLGSPSNGNGNRRYQAMSTGMNGGLFYITGNGSVPPHFRQRV